jgi:hypothetical protein
MNYLTHDFLIQTALPILSSSSNLQQFNLQQFNQKILILEFVFKMQFPIFATIGAALLTYPTNAYAQETTLNSLLPTTTATNTYKTTTTQGVICLTLPTCGIPATGICTTITTQGVNCPTLSTCIVPDCLRIVQVILVCGCASIFTSTTCATDCPGTSYNTIFLPCSSTALTSNSDNSTASSELTTTTSTVVTPTETGSTATTTNGSPTFTTANSAKKWRSDTALSGLIIAILGLL